jgi:hypothetical protein
MYKCWYYDHEVAWVGDFMESEVTGEEMENPRYDRVVGYYKCPSCGSDFEFRQGPSCEQEEEINQLSHNTSCQSIKSF